MSDFAFKPEQPMVRVKDSERTIWQRKAERERDNNRDKLAVIIAAIRAAESRRMVLIGGSSRILPEDWQRILDAAGVVDSLKGNG